MTEGPGKRLEIRIASQVSQIFSPDGMRSEGFVTIGLILLTFSGPEVRRDVRNTQKWLDPIEGGGTKVCSGNCRNDGWVTPKFRFRVLLFGC